MAKQLNKQLVILLTIGGMVLTGLAGVMLVSYLPERNPNYYVKQAEEASAKGEHRKASRLYSRAWRVSNKAMYLVYAGQEALEAGDIDAARKAWQQAIILTSDARDTRDPDPLAPWRAALAAHENLVRFALQVAPYSGGTTGWEQVDSLSNSLLALPQGQNSSMGLYARGLARLALRNVKTENEELGKADLIAANRMAPEDPDIANGLARYVEDRGILKDEEARRAEAEARQLESQGQQAAANRRRAEAETAREESKRFYEEAERILRETVRMAERNAAATQPTTRPAVAFEDRSPAEAAAAAHRYCGEFLVRRARWDDALEEFNKAVALAPRSVENHVALGQYWAARGMADQAPAAGTTQPSAPPRIREDCFAKARDALIAACELDPREYVTFITLGKLYRMHGDLEQAAKVYDQRLARGGTREGLKNWLDQNYRLLLLDEAFQTTLQRLSATTTAEAEKTAESDLVKALEGYYRKASAEARTGENDPRVLFMKGRIELVKRNYREAIKALEGAIKNLPPNDPLGADIRFVLGNAYSVVGETGEAVRQWEDLLQRRQAQGRAPGDDELARYAAALLANRDPRAGQVADQALRLNAANRTALSVALQVARGQNNTARVAEIEKQLGIQTDPTSIPAVLARIQQSLMPGDPTEKPSPEAIRAAESELRKLLEKDPVQRQVLYFLLNLLVADNRTAEIPPVIDKAIAAAGAIADEQERAAFVRALQSLRIRTEPGRSPEEVLKAREELIAQETNPATRELQFVQLYMSVNDPKKAAEHAKKALSLGDVDTQTLEAFLSLALTAKDEAWASEIVKKAAAQNADGAGGRLFASRKALSAALAAQNAGDSATAAKEFDRAIAECRAGLEVLGTSSPGQTLLGQILMAAGRFDEAKAALTRATEINPNLGAAWISLGQIAERRGQTDEVEKCFARARVLAPQAAWVVQKLREEMERKNPEQAIAAYEEMRKSIPADPEKIELGHIGNLIRLGQLYAQVGKPDQAEKVLQEALEKNQANDRLKNRSAPHFYAQFLLERTDKPDPQRGMEILKAYAQSLNEKEEKASAMLLVGQYMQEWARRGLPGAPSLADIDATANAAVNIADTYEVLMGLGTWYRQSNRPMQAVDYYKRAAEKAPQTPEGRERAKIAKRYMLDTLILTTNDQRRAEVDKAIDAYIQEHPDDANGLLLKGHHCMVTNRVDEAYEAFTRCIEKDRGNAQAYFRRGGVLFRKAFKDGNWDRAMEDLREAKRLAPSAFDYEHRIMLASCLQKKGDTAAAVAELETILQEDPAAANVPRIIVDMYDQADKRAQAEEKATEFRNRYPDDPYWPLRLAQLAERQEVRNPARIIALCRAAAETGKDPRGHFRPDLVTQVLRAMMTYQQYDELIDYMTRTVPPEKRMPEHLAMLGMAYAKKKQDDQARKVFDEALNAARGSLSESSRVADILRNAYDVPAAVKTFRDRFATAPNDRTTQYVLGTLLIVAGDAANAEGRADEAKADRAEAEKLLKDALAGVKDTADKLIVMRGLSTIYYAEKRYDEAEQTYREMLQLEPNDAFALNNLAYMLMTDLNKPKEAEPYARRAAAVSGNNANIIDTFGWNLALLGRHAEALDQFSLAIETDPFNTIATYHRGLTYKKLSDAETDAARKDQLLRRARDDARRAFELASRKREADALRDVAELMKELGLPVPATQPAAPG